MRGAVESSEPRGPSQLVDHPQRVAALTALVAVLGTVSTVQYVTRWQDDLKAERYFGQLLPTIEGAKQPMPLVDQPVPDYIMWPLATPTTC